MIITEDYIIKLSPLIKSKINKPEYRCNSGYRRELERFLTYIKNKTFVNGFNWDLSGTFYADKETVYRFVVFYEGEIALVCQY